MKYHVELKKILKREEIVILKREELEVCDKIMSSFKVTHLFLSFLYSFIKFTPSKVSCKNVCTTR